MIAIIAEKPSVGQDIARVVGATERHDGSMSGNGYTVTWALGDLVFLALPASYGHERLAAADLPVIPDPFRLVLRERKTDRGLTPDPAAAKQLRIIDEVLSHCDQIIVATDASREGELLFRYIYAYLGYTKPFRRLWISSFTDEAILTGMQHLRDGHDYDGLYHAADCRAKADWLVGINASQALAITSGMGNNSLGRVQTPTLSMLCARYNENRNFVPADFWRLHITLQADGAYRRFHYVEELRSKAEAERALSHLHRTNEARITKSERKKVFQSPPRLYDLAALQKECNIRFDFTSEKTLDLAQSLYERKLISYPRTGSCSITGDVLPQIPALLAVACALPEFATYGKTFDCSQPAAYPVDAKKFADHHALIITGISPTELSASERQVYTLIAGRMLEAFSQRSEKEALTMEAEVDGLLFRSRSHTVSVPGWRRVFSRSEDREPEEMGSDEGTAAFAAGQTVPIAACGFGHGKTTPKPLYTEATLLTAMEHAGREVPDDKTRKAMLSGIGTPATRTTVIATLLKGDYIERSGKSLLPTEKGLFVYNAVRQMRIADAELTESWEIALSQIEQHKLPPESFLTAMAIYAGQVTEEVLSIRFPPTATSALACPKCGEGRIIIRHKIAKCGNSKCGLLVLRRFFGKELSDRDLEQLFSTGKTRLMKGFSGKKGKPFDAAICFDDHFNLTLSSAPKK